MNLLIIALILGVVEGLTEFIPVSSTGHLILVAEWLKFNSDKAKTFEVFIQLGAILAVVVLYKERFLGLLRSGEGYKGARGIRLIILSILPAAILGFFLRDFIKENLFNPGVVAASLLIGGLVLHFVETFVGKLETDSLDKMGHKHAVMVGLLQCFSLIPGVSRSGATIVGGMMSGLDRKTAAEHSFIVAVPLMMLAVTYDLFKSLNILSASDIPMFAVGFIVSFITAILAIKLFVEFVSTHSLRFFAWYRIALGLIIIVWY